MDKNILSVRERDEIFSDLIWPRFEYGLIRQDQPQAHILGGQPGAGKSHFIRVLQSTLSDRPASVVNADDLRGYHPFYSQFLESNERDAADLTQSDVNFWVERCIKKIAEQHGDMIIEGTMRRPEVPIGTASFLNRKEYGVTAHVILTAPEVSLADIFLRYELQKKLIGVARFTKPDMHREASQSFGDSILAIERSGQFEKIKLYRRATTNYELRQEIHPQNNPESNADASNELLSFLENEKARVLSEAELLYINKAWAEVFSLSEARGASSDYLEELKRWRGEVFPAERRRKLR